jgi:hypothetical protein
LVAVDSRAACAGLLSPDGADERDWRQICELLEAEVGERMFEIWLAAIELRAVHPDGKLVLVAPETTGEWVRTRFGRLIEQLAAHVGRQAVIANRALSVALLAADLASVPARGPAQGQSADASYDMSACAPSYTSAYTPAKEVSHGDLLRQLPLQGGREGPPNHRAWRSRESSPR